MFSVNWVYGMWAEKFRNNLVGGFFKGAISFDKDTLFLQFIDNQTNPFTVECKFIDGHLILLPSEKEFERNGSKKGIIQFKEIELFTITSIASDPQDRWICLSLSNDNELWIKGFGKFGNVLLRQKETSETLSIFRLSLKSDWDFQYPSLSTEERNWRESSSLTHTGEEWKNWGLTKKPEDLGSLVSAQLNFLRDYYFQENKAQLKENIDRKVKHLRKILNESKRRLTEIEQRRSYKEIGDLILAHAHALKPGLTKALITDYYTDQRIWIKLNPELSASDNAKKYYRKAKNEVIEQKKLLERIITTEKNLAVAEQKFEGVSKAEDFKGLKSYQKTLSKVQTQADTLPYQLHEFQGYQIWVGKNNKSNDQLLRLSQKNDLWLHAKDVGGSHVIIRKKGANYPQAVIDFAAVLAAKNSKAKTQNVVPVIVVLRKFVSKPKNAAPGEVSLQKEDIVDAFIF
ncbi:MAG: DUF814 domain-containing protein [Bacteroidetes bacterium]|nr:DUF814 domain-containing protein [Bacteroidota bacterium]